MYSEPYDIYRGVVRVRGKKWVGGQSPVDFETNLYTKAYQKSGTARGQATILRKAQKQSDVVDVWVEKATVWENIDNDPAL